MNSELKVQVALLVNAIANDMYHPLGTINLSGFVANKHLTLEDAQTYPCTDYPEGHVWGDKEDYGWMFGEFTIPENAKDQRVVMNLNVGGEATIFLNGKPFGTRRTDSVRYEHHLVVDQTITSCAQGGEHVRLALEAFAGVPMTSAPLGRRSSGPLFPEKEIPMMRTELPKIGVNTFGTWNEDAYQLWLDLLSLRDLYDVEPEDSFLREKIGYVLGELLNTIEIEVEPAKRREAYVEARELLAPVMAANNGTFAPEMSIVANSHLDLAWLWPREETVRKTARTFAQQLRLLEDYPEAKFVASQSVLYEMCKEHYPEVYEKIKEAIKRGQWIADGGMWVEPDTNLSGGEALIRQFLYGRAFFREELGVEGDTAWLPDTFGYTGAMPQILKGCGIKGLTTQKIEWSYNDSVRFPHHAFMWRGIDGTGVPSYLHMNYGTHVDVKSLREFWSKRVDQDGSGDFFVPFGYGDGGGGPTRDEYEQARRHTDLQGVPKLKYETPAEYLAKKTQLDLPEYRGELYFPCHRGTYTTQAAIKQGNRRSEKLLRALEAWNAFAVWQGETGCDAERLEAMWKEVLFNQFHDVLPGTSIRRVNEEALELYEDVRVEAEALIDHTLARLTGDSEGITLFNDLSRDQIRFVALDASFAEGAVTTEGALIPCQPWMDGALAMVEVPAMGRVSLVPKATAKDSAVRAYASDDGYVLENECVKVLINDQGEITSMVDKDLGISRIGGLSNRFHLYRDIPRYYEAWDIDSQTEDREVFPEKKVSVEILCEEGLRSALRVTTEVSESRIEQIISLDAGAKRVDFDTQVDWQERHRLLKVSFDTGIDSLLAANQIQFGYIERPNHRSEAWEKDRFEVCNHEYTALYDATHGAAVLNDSKYGVSTNKGVIGLSLLRASTNPDPVADLGEHRFTYSYYFWDGSFADSGVVWETGILNNEIRAAKGSSGKQSFFEVSDSCVVLETVKLAEDGSGDMIVRLYEAMNGVRRASFTSAFPVAKAYRCNMLEEIENEVIVDDGRIDMSFKPFEIVTLRLKKES